VTVIIGSATFFILPRNPATAKFLSDSERESILLALERDREFQEEQEDFSWGTCLDALRAPHMWLIFVQFFCSGGKSLVTKFWSEADIRQSCCTLLPFSRLVRLTKWTLIAQN
jgi:hypothetical protein